ALHPRRRQSGRRRQRPARRAAQLPPRTLRRFPLRPRWQQHRGRLPRPPLARGDEEQRHPGAGEADGCHAEDEEAGGNDHALGIGSGLTTLHPRMSALDPLTDDQRAIRELVRTIAREKVGPRAAEIDKSGEFPWDVVEAFRENELFGVMYDEEFGGIGESSLLTLVAIEELSKVCATSGLIIAVQELGSLGIKLA